MSNAKDTHYWTQLRSALTGGLWASPFPGKAPNGTALSWSELLRKFNKHNPGFADVSEVASQTQALALLLAANSSNEDDTDAGPASDYSLAIGSTSTLPPERLKEAKSAYAVLGQLQPSNYDSLNFALAYYAYALGQFSDCLAHLAKVPDIPDIQSHIPAPASGRNLNVNGVNKTAASLHVPGTEPSSISWSGSFASDASVSIAEIRDGRAWSMTETIRSICLTGMANEKLHPSEPQKALDVYKIALPLLKIAETEITSPAPTQPAHAHRTIPSGPGKLDFSCFTRFRELWRWIEQLLFRAISLSAMVHDLHETGGQSIWTWFTHYSTCMARWPTSFRAQHRCTISTLYLRALVIRAQATAPQQPPLPKESDKPPAWLVSARSTIQEYQSILNVCTRFPKAGERNVKLEDFVDLCVAVWEASGESGASAGWVIDTLWWATRLTFNSHRILRHMTRLLYVSGDTELAKRTLQLYVQVVSKAYLSGHSNASGITIDGDLDTDAHWVETLVQGARMLCRLAMAEAGITGTQDAKQAGILLEKAKARLDVENSELVASVKLAEGIWNRVMAFKEQDPRTRPSRLLESHHLLQQSVEIFSTPAAHFHLALSFAHPGPTQDLDMAMTNITSAVEGEPREIRYWHLLGLLLTATEQWKPAMGALDEGAAISDDDSFIIEPSVVPDSLGQPDGLQAKDFVLQVNGKVPSIDGLPSSTSSSRSRPVSRFLPPEQLLEPGTAHAPSSSSLLRSLLDHPQPSRNEIFEYALQLRMTQVAVAEYVEGPEGAGDKWVEVFSWIAEKRGIGIEHKGSISADETPVEPTINGVTERDGVQPTLIEEENASEVRDSIDELPETSTLNVIPINVIPATPGDSEILQQTQSQVFFTKEEEDAQDKENPEKDTSKGKKMQQKLKDGVHKGQAKITTISKKIGHGVSARTGSLRRSNSTPDFYSVLRTTNYQASSIHSRRRLSSITHHDQDDRSHSHSPPPPPPAIPAGGQMTKGNSQTSRDNLLFSNLWLMSAATFRRAGKIEQAKGSIQEAEVKDEDNPAVWVQLGLYHMALGRHQNHHAMDAFHKALFIDPDNISATVHLCGLYLTPTAGPAANANAEVDRDNVDLAAGMLSNLTSGCGYAVPEAWYYLAKAYGLQGRKDKERECLSRALELSEKRVVRDIASSVGWCL